MIARELTKKFETIVTLKQCDLEKVSELVLDKGEFVILFHNEAADDQISNTELKTLVNDFLETGGGTKKLSKIFSKILGEDSKLIYNKLK